MRLNDSGPHFMLTFYLRFHIYAIEIMSFQRNISSYLPMLLVSLYVTLLYSSHFFRSLSIANNKVRLYSRFTVTDCCDCWLNFNLKYRQPSLCAVFLSAILCICDPEMSSFLERILWFTVILGLFMWICYMRAYFWSSYLSLITRSTCIQEQGPMLYRNLLLG